MEEFRKISVTKSIVSPYIFPVDPSKLGMTKVEVKADIGSHYFHEYFIGYEKDSEWAKKYLYEIVKNGIINVLKK
jgi:hypothetical protein